MLAVLVSLGLFHHLPNLWNSTDRYSHIKGKASHKIVSDGMFSALKTLPSL